MKAEDREMLMQKYNFDIGYLTALKDILKIDGDFERCFEGCLSVEVYHFMMNVHSLVADRAVFVELFEEQQKLTDISKLEDWGAYALRNAVKEVGEEKIKKSLEKVLESYGFAPSVSDITSGGNLNSCLKRLL